MIQLRTNGIKTPQIAEVMGIGYKVAYNTLWSVFNKLGITDIALLTRWALKYGFDERLEEESPDLQPIPEPRTYQQRIQQARIRRAGVKMEKLRRPGKLRPYRKLVK